MPLVSRKGILAIAAVIDVAINARMRPVSAKALAARHKLPPRHLEPVLQALVRDGTRYTVLGVAADGVTRVGSAGRFTETSRYLIIAAYEVTDE